MIRHWLWTCVLGGSTMIAMGAFTLWTGSLLLGIVLGFGVVFALEYTRNAIVARFFPTYVPAFPVETQHPPMRAEIADADATYYRRVILEEGWKE